MALEQGFYIVRSNVTLESKGGQRVTISRDDRLATNGKVIGLLLSDGSWKDTKVEVTPEVESKLKPALSRPKKYSELGAPLKASRPELGHLGLWLHMHEDAKAQKAPNNTWEPKSDAYKPNPKAKPKLRAKPKARPREVPKDGPLLLNDEPRTAAYNVVQRFLAKL